MDLYKLTTELPAWTQAGRINKTLTEWDGKIVLQRSTEGKWSCYVSRMEGDTEIDGICDSVDSPVEAFEKAIQSVNNKKGEINNDSFRMVRINGQGNSCFN